MKGWRSIVVYMLVGVRIMILWVAQGCISLWYTVYLGLSVRLYRLESVAPDAERSWTAKVARGACLVD
jgi:hypothetical protein